MARDEGIGGVLLSRDSDGVAERRRGLEQARVRRSGEWPFCVVIGVAEPKREAWVLAGFEPEDDDDSERLAGLWGELGCDPRERSHEFTARTPGSKRELKRILGLLTGDRAAREEPCWNTTPLELLRARGVGNGLAAYLDEVERSLVPLVGG